jgi:hypothetical protein
MSLVRVGMSDNKKVSAGWETVFGKKKPTAKTTPLKKQTKSKKK